MLDGFGALFFHRPGSPWGALWALVGVLGLLWYFQLSRKYLWLSRIVIGLTLGIGAGLSFQSLIGQNMPQVVDSFRPLAPQTVGPQPVKRFALPPSVVPAVLADPVVYVAQARQVQCVEIMGGVVVWTSPLAVAPTKALSIDGDDLIVPTAGSDLHFDKNTGAAKAGTPNDPSVLALLDAGGHKIEVRPDGLKGLDPAPNLHGATISSACVMPGLLDDSGKDRDVVFLVVNGVPEAIDATDGKIIWVGNPRLTADAVWDGGRELFAAKDGVLKLVDPNTGKLLGMVRAGGPVQAASAAHMSEPTQDLLQGVMAEHGTALAAALARDDPAASRKAGEVLWTYETHKPIIWTTTLDGVLLADGPQGGGCYEIPQVQKRLVAQDYADNWVFVIALMSVMTYFFFSFKQRTAKGVAQFSTVGRWTLMIGFGAIFGNTVMTRMSFLLDRLMVLHDDWLIPFLRAVWHLMFR
jgi:hypothetical protein